MNYYPIFSQSIEKPYGDKVIFIFKNKDALNKAKSDFEGQDYEEILVQSKSESINRYNGLNTEEYRLLVTDIPALTRKSNKLSTTLYKLKKEKAQSYIITDGSIDLSKVKEMHLNNYVVVESENPTIEKEFMKLNRRHARKVFIINNKKMSLNIKDKNVWRPINNLDMEFSYLMKIGKKIEVEDNKMLPLKLREFNSVLEGAKLERGEIIYDDSYWDSSVFKDKINWFLSFEFYIDYINLSTSGFFTKYLYKEIILKEKNEFNSLMNRMKNGQEVQGIDYVSFNEIKEGLISIITVNGEILIRQKGNLLQVYINSKFITSESDSFYYSNSIANNIESNINIILNKSKFNKRDIINTVIGLLVLLVLLILTFEILYKGIDFTSFFQLIFSKESFNKPWIYYIIFSFVLSFFYPLLIAIFIEKFVLKNKSISYKRLNIYFMASIFRRVASFLTGNYIISTFIWGWYINRKLSIRTSQLIGGISSVSIWRSIFFITIGSFFMVLGTISYFTIYDGIAGGNTLIVMLASWTGFIWEATHKLLLYLLATSAVFLSFVTNQINKFKYFNKGIPTYHLEKSYYSIKNIQFNSVNLGNWEVEKQRFFRAFLFVIIPLVIEGFETLAYFNLIDSLTLSNSLEFKPYWNVFSITSIRFMATNIHFFPIINLLPGKGLFFSEYGLDKFYILIFMNQHSSELGLWNNGVSYNDLSIMTTFITRFFNVYLPVLVSAIVTLIIVAYEIIIRKKVKYE